MTASNDNDRQRSAARRRWRAPTGVYRVVAAVIAIGLVRLLLWLLSREGVLSEEDGNLVMLAGLPAALLLIGWLAPRDVPRFVRHVLAGRQP